MHMRTPPLPSSLRTRPSSSRVCQTTSVLNINPKFSIKISNPRPPIIRNNPNQALSHIFNIIVIVQELDMALDGLLGRLTVKISLHPFLWAALDGTYVNPFVTSPNLARWTASSASIDAIFPWIAACRTSISKNFGLRGRWVNLLSSMLSSLLLERLLCWEIRRWEWEPRWGCSGWHLHLLLLVVTWWRHTVVDLEGKGKEKERQGSVYLHVQGRNMLFLAWGPKTLVYQGSSEIPLII